MRYKVVDLEFIKHEDFAKIDFDCIENEEIIQLLNGFTNCWSVNRLGHLENGTRFKACVKISPLTAFIITDSVMIMSIPTPKPAASKNIPYRVY